MRRGTTCDSKDVEMAKNQGSRGQCATFGNMLELGGGGQGGNIIFIGTQ